MATVSPSLGLQRNSEQQGTGTTSIPYLCLCLTTSPSLQGIYQSVLIYQSAFHLNIKNTCVMFVCVYVQYVYITYCIYSIYLTVCLCFTYIIHLSICMSVSPSFQFLHPYVGPCLSVCLPVCLPIHRSVCQACTPVCLRVQSGRRPRDGSTSAEADLSAP